MKLKELSLGSRIVDQGSNVSFLVADQNHYAGNTTTMITEFVIRAGCFDAAERKASDDTAKFGCNCYATSNIASWLNSDQWDWYVPQSETDEKPAKPHLLYNEMPYDQVLGFLYAFSPEWKEALVETEIDTLVRTGKKTGEVRELKTKVFLPSRTELCWGNESGYPEGTPIALFEKDKKYLKTRPSDEMLEIYGRSWNPGWEFGGRIPSAKLDAPQIYDPKYGWWYWTRTPHLTYEFLVRVKDSYGSLTYTTAYNDIVGIRPIMNLNGDTEVELAGDEYRIVAAKNME